MAQKRNLSQAKIIASARKLAKEIGVRQLTFQNLAVDLHVKYPSLYNHFKNIGEVKAALTDLLIQELNDLLRRALVGKSGSAAILAYAEVYQTFAFDNAAVYELLISVPQTENPHLIKRIQETNQIILQILAVYPLTQEERLHKSRELRSLIHGYISLRFLGYFQKEAIAKPEESYQRMIADFIQSLEV
ncbi:TetR/AcrR family transcriptional regulator [Enterococcus faecalis]